MTDTRIYQQALKRLKEALIQLDRDDVDASRRQVFARFQPLFSADHLVQLTEGEFRDFLMLKNNRHWSGLHRLGPKMCIDMPLLRRALAVLIDEDRPIEERLDDVTRQINGMGKAVATAILLIVFPAKYGVWNRTSEGGLKALDLWPASDRGASLGQRYAQINEVLNRLARDLKIDLWALDMLWWGLVPDGGDGPSGTEEPPVEVETPEDTGDVPFSLERHLHDFLRDNWDRTSLGKEWGLYDDNGQDAEAGYEYPCGAVGYIDLLARHKKESQWLVIELKRGQTSDATLGQVLRYMGWIETHLAGPEESVRGLIIAHEVDDKLLYAAKAVPRVDLECYEVQFHLHPVAQPAKEQR